LELKAQVTDVPVARAITLRNGKRQMVHAGVSDNFVSRLTTLQRNRLAAPLLRQNIGYRLSECPTMSFHVIGSVLTFAIGIGFWRPDDCGSVLHGVLIMAIHIFHSDHHRVIDVSNTTAAVSGSPRNDNH